MPVQDFSAMTFVSNMIRTTSLTEREIEIIDALSQGLSSDEISTKLFISTFTVNTHRRNAMIKLNAKNAAHLVRICCEEGIIADKPLYCPDCHSEILRIKYSNTFSVLSTLNL